MDTNYRANIGKWLPPPGDALEKWFANSSMLTKRIDNLVESIALIIQDITNAQSCDFEVRLTLLWPNFGRDSVFHSESLDC